MKYSMGIAWRGVALSLIAGSAVAVHAQDRTDALAVTKHQIEIGDTRLQYTATAGRIPVRPSGSDEPHAQMFFVSYRLDQGAKATTPRPLTGSGTGARAEPRSPCCLADRGPS